MQKFDVAIVGAGASGIMAAITAKRNGASVILLEKNQSIGRKILSTGNGRCNITNKFTKAENYHGSSQNFIANILASFDQNKTISFFEKLSLVLKEEDNGRMFPKTNQAKTVVELLSHEIEALGIVLKTGKSVKMIKKKNDFGITLEDGSQIFAKKLILSSGGKASHQLGSSGDGYYFAKSLGILVKDIYAALVPLETKESWVKDLQGLKVEAKVSFYVRNQLISERTGDVMFTHYGLSGPAVMSQTGFIADKVKDGSVSVRMDFEFEKTVKELDSEIASIFNTFGQKTAKNALIGMVPLNLICVIMRELNIDEKRKAAEISKLQRAQIVDCLKSMTLHVSSLRPLKEAQVTRGGISESEIIADTLECKKHKGLYFAGEVLDVDGDSGGFNLQWAWSSGYVAGINASKSAKINKED